MINFQIVGIMKINPYSNILITDKDDTNESNESNIKKVLEIGDVLNNTIEFLDIRSISALVLCNKRMIRITSFFLETLSINIMNPNFINANKHFSLLEARIIFNNFFILLKSKNRTTATDFINTRYINLKEFDLNELDFNDKKNIALILKQLIIEFYNTGKNKETCLLYNSFLENDIMNSLSEENKKRICAFPVMTDYILNDCNPIEKVKDTRFLNRIMQNLNPIRNYIKESLKDESINKKNFYSLLFSQYFPAMMIYLQLEVDAIEAKIVFLKNQQNIFKERTTCLNGSKLRFYLDKLDIFFSTPRYEKPESSSTLSNCFDDIQTSILRLKPYLIELENHVKELLKKENKYLCENSCSNILDLYTFYIKIKFFSHLGKTNTFLSGTGINGKTNFDTIKNIIYDTNPLFKSTLINNRLLEMKLIKITCFISEILTIGNNKRHKNLAKIYIKRISIYLAKDKIPIKNHLDLAEKQYKWYHTVCIEFLLYRVSIKEKLNRVDVYLELNDIEVIISLIVNFAYLKDFSRSAKNSKFFISNYNYKNSIYKIKNKLKNNSYRFKNIEVLYHLILSCQKNLLEELQKNLSGANNHLLNTKQEEKLIKNKAIFDEYDRLIRQTISKGSLKFICDNKADKEIPKILQDIQQIEKGLMLVVSLLP